MLPSGRLQLASSRTSRRRSIQHHGFGGCGSGGLDFDGLMFPAQFPEPDPRLTTPVQPLTVAGT
jgi:hypothetical protein